MEETEHLDTLPGWFRAVALRRGQHLAVVEGSSVLTYSQLEDEVNHLAGELRAAGVSTGSRVGLMLPNGLDFVVGYRALAALGATIVPLHDGLRAQDLLSVLTVCPLSSVLTHRSRWSLAQSAVRERGLACPVLLAEEGRGALRQARRFDPLSVSISADDAPNLMLTSGSTDQPKQVARSHRKIVTELKSLVQALGLTSEDRFIGVATFAHANGMMRSLFASQFVGATLYAMPRFQRRAVVDLIERERITVFGTVAFMYSILAEGVYHRRPDLSSVRWAISGSAPLSVQANQRFQQQFGFHVRQLYAGTETGNICLNMDADISRTLDSVGTPLPGIEIRLFDEGRKPVAPGATGEIGVREPYVFDGYAGRADPTRSAFHDGFFLTGDLGRQDDAGRLYLTGRVALVINRGGLKIDPLEIEQCLSQHPKIKEAVVMGVPSSSGDERVKAVVVTKKVMTTAEVVAYCQTRLADYKVPGLVEFRTELPKTAAGKVRREELRGGQ